MLSKTIRIFTLNSLPNVRYSVKFEDKLESSRTAVGVSQVVCNVKRVQAQQGI